MAQPRSTIEDLYRTPGQAELVDGLIVRRGYAGAKPACVAGRVYRSLADHAERTRSGIAGMHRLGYVVPPLPSGRVSFCPDASYYSGSLPADPMRFISDAPTLAAEVRSEDDYGPGAEIELAAKRADYFAAATLAVWDVDSVNECIRLYCAGAPDQPVTFRRGETAEAEPAVPGWRVEVDWLFR